MARRLAALVIAGGLFMAACSIGPGASPVPGTPGATPSVAAQPTPGADGIVLLTANLPRASASEADAAAAASGINAFGLELFHRLASAGQNAVVSPASIVLALAMTRAGAVGSTADEMDAVLHGVASAAKAPGLNALEQALASRNAQFGPGLDGVEREVTLRIANAPFAQRDMPIEQSYLDALASLYGAGLRLVDYRTQSEAARELINGWVGDQTEQRIPELLQDGFLTPQSRLTLVNAIYLKASWLQPFLADFTQPDLFTRGDGSTVSVPFMHATQGLAYATGDGWKAVDLPYVGEQLTMTLIMPDDLASFEANLDAARLDAIVRQLKPAEVEISLPKFSIETKADFANLLSAMGMPTAFDPAAADFSGITTAERLFIAGVVHQANIDVDEDGTVAAAATAVGMGAAGLPQDFVKLALDHPFLFVLRDSPTGTVLFLGHVADPSLGYH